MSQQLAARRRTGWNHEETSLLWEEVGRISGDGASLKEAFERIAQHTGRKPNSIRNYYYACLKNNTAPGGFKRERAQPFIPFSEDETQWLLAEILTAQAGGESVRACVQRLAKGDRTVALRYQNKYRSVLKSHPDRVVQTLENLKQQGLSVKDPYARGALRGNFTLNIQQDSENLDADERLMRALCSYIAANREMTELREQELSRLGVRCELYKKEALRIQQNLDDARTALQSAIALRDMCAALNTPEARQAISHFDEAVGMLA